MKKLSPIVTLYLMTLFCDQVHAQKFKNGSLEPAAGASFTTCSDNYPGNINSMGYIYLTAIGYPLAYVSNSTCGLGAAADGNYFLGLHYIRKASPSGTQLLLELDKVMKAGTSYNFSFYYRGPALTFGTGADLSYGYAADTGSASDTLVGYITRPSDPSWVQVTRSVTPKSDSKYIWVQAYSSSASDTVNITYVDYFDIYAESVPTIENNSAIQLYPNPFSSFINLKIGDNLQLPCQYSIYDITGRIIKENLSITNKTTAINIDGIKDGIYFIQLTDKQKNIYTTKLIKTQ